jgi:hypothetical protein
VPVLCQLQLAHLLLLVEPRPVDGFLHAFTAIALPRFPTAAGVACTDLALLPAPDAPIGDLKPSSKMTDHVPMSVNNNENSVCYNETDSMDVVALMDTKSESCQNHPILSTTDKSTLHGATSNPNTVGIQSSPRVFSLPFNPSSVEPSFQSSSFVASSLADLSLENNDMYSHKFLLIDIPSGVLESIYGAVCFVSNYLV